MKVASRIVTPLCTSALAIFIACGGSSPDSAGKQPTAFNSSGGSPSIGGGSDATAPTSGDEGGGGGSGSSSSSSGGSSSGGNGCPSSCSVDSDCSSCNAPAQGESNCCMAGMCYMYTGTSCPVMMDAGATE
jgi:hypothetical protein